MPFPMTHFLVAGNILKVTPSIRDDAAFILGSVAPDAVHCRSDYRSEDKQKSHLCEGLGKWGMLSDYNAWLENIFAFFKNAMRNDHDFLYGYCVHILCDICGNVHNWAPFRTAYPEEAARGYRNAMTLEDGAADVWLWQNTPERDAIFERLRRGSCRDVFDWVTAGEIEGFRDGILRERYAGAGPVDISGHRFAAEDAVRSFIGTATKYVLKILKMFEGENTV